MAGRKMINIAVMVCCMLFLIISMQVNVEAARMLSSTEEDFAGANHLDTFPNSVYEKAKETMSFWLERLASGPSPRGPGH
ncbi:OLC1v1008244C1 [Oldenlandia corymbosa var. corymbosa]|uniref:OLC1v1008244C1 n=1 Tax=Oldenlandia corymbosa var. corymbosa TaxID=529605 RepID=A0AAV1DL47_OLDCO|nr:OLC1v1008244C1 [Oldenlandia corymbosa var. corymbosa]